MSTGAFDGRDMSDGEFCIVCGASPPLTTDRMCEPCLRDRTSLSVMPERIQQDRCSKCGFHEIRGRWSVIDSNDLADLRIRASLGVEDRAKQVSVEFAVEEIDDRTSRLHVDVSGIIEGYEFSDSHEVLYRPVTQFVQHAHARQVHISRQ